MRKILKFALAAFLLISFLPVKGQTVPEGFQLEVVSEDWIAPAGMTYAENGFTYAWELNGLVWVIENGIKDAAPIIDISEEVAFYGDLGMTGFALDPNFLSNGYVYLLYALDKHYLTQFGTGNYDPDHTDMWQAQTGRVTRFQLSTSDYRTIVPGSRFILLGNDFEDGIAIPSPTHGVGSLAFGADGSLMITAGEGTTWVDFHTGGLPVPDFGYDDQGLALGMLEEYEDVGSFRSQLLNSVNGKLLRINPQTGEGYPSNPFYNEENPNSDQSKVWALGLRNPFRFTKKPNTGSLNPEDGNPGSFYIGDVGLDKWEEINVSNDPGQNFGWPRYEGMVLQPGYDPKPTEHILLDNPLFNGTNCQTEHYRFRDLIQQPNSSHTNFFGNPCDGFEPIEDIRTFIHERPVIAYMNEANSAEDKTLIPGFNSSGESQGVSIIDAELGMEEFEGISSVGGAFYNSVNYPEEYFGAYFHADFSGWIKTFWFDENDNLIKAEPFLNDMEGIIHLSVNPFDGCLYFPHIFSGKFYRVCFAENLKPIAEAEADIYFGPSPLTVEFDGSESFDPDNDPITFDWDFGDGSSSMEESPSHTFVASGTDPEMFEIQLNVTDSANNIGTKTLIVSLNNTPPEVDITSFNEGDLYPLQQTSNLPLEASVNDAEHSQNDLTYTWQTFFHHNTHFHPQPIDNNISTSTFIQPAPCEENVTYYYRIRLEVEDAAGLKGYDEKSVFPDCNDTIPLPVPEDIILFPNPGIDYMTIKGNFDLDPVKIDIYNQVGQKIYSETIMPEGSSNIPVEIFQLRSGMYIMRIETEGESQSIRFVKSQ